MMTTRSSSSKKETENECEEIGDEGVSPFFSEQKPKKKRTKISIRYEDATVVKPNTIWEPFDWKSVYANIKEMRKMKNAPVDSLGAEQCADKSAPPEVFRFQVLVSLMLSSQTKDQVTFNAVKKLKTNGLNIKNILNLPDDELGSLIYPVSFWKRKVDYLKKTCAILERDYAGDIPSSFEGLCDLPGVGPKMAHLVLSIAWDRTEGIGVDTHVHRIANRLSWVPKPTKEPEQTRLALQAWMRQELWLEVNTLLVGFGQTVCLPVGPKCNQCLNFKICPSSAAKVKKK